MLIERYHWTFADIDSMDPDDYTELTSYIRADSAVEHKHRPKKK